MINTRHLLPVMITHSMALLGRWWRRRPPSGPRWLVTRGLLCVLTRGGGRRGPVGVAEDVGSACASWRRCAACLPLGGGERAGWCTTGGLQCCCCSPGISEV
uniref:Uncharacterized protein n=1 Tax=Cacopsylla melanoneura TaxID=428564 RepID=A0A8D9BDD6_9HEMI